MMQHPLLALTRFFSISIASSHFAAITLPDGKSEDDSAISLSSDESDLWNQPTETTEIIANITELDKTSSTNDEEIAMLMARIKELQNNGQQPMVNKSTPAATSLSEPSPMEVIDITMETTERKKNPNTNQTMDIAIPQQIDKNHFSPGETSSKSNNTINDNITTDSHSQQTAKATSTENGANN